MRRRRAFEAPPLVPLWRDAARLFLVVADEGAIAPARRPLVGPAARAPESGRGQDVPLRGQHFDDHAGTSAAILPPQPLQPRDGVVDAQGHSGARQLDEHPPTPRDKGRCGQNEKNAPRNSATCTRQGGGGLGDWRRSRGRWRTEFESP